VSHSRKADAETPEILARAHTRAALDALRAALDCPGERVDAARELLARAWGQPPQVISIDATHLTIECHDAAPEPTRVNGEDAERPASVQPGRT
jgi:hypothetical protein